MSAKTAEMICGKELHPLCALFPEMEDSELDALAADIKTNGQQQPILTYEGKIVDGRNRLIACERAAVEPLIRPWTPRGSESIVAAIAGLNLHRRHLTASQRAMLAAELIPFFEEEARARQVETRAQPGEKIGASEHVSRVSADLRAPEDSGKSAAKAAAATGASTRATEQAKRVAKAAPKLAEKVKAGKVSIDKAEKQVKAKKAKRQPQTSGKHAMLQERWEPIAAAVRRLCKALHMGLVLTDDGALSAEDALEELVKIGKGAITKPEFLAVDLARTRKALDALSPIVTRLYGKAGK